MGDNFNTGASDSGYTLQGQMVAEHWARLAVTYEGAIEELRSKVFVGRQGLQVPEGHFSSSVSGCSIKALTPPPVA